jgi:hypothetical protein
MDAWNNITFTASNGIGIGLRCRYRQTTYLNFRIDGKIIELEHIDDFATINVDSAYLGFSPDTQKKILAAYDEYNADKARQYAQWRKDNAALFDAPQTIADRVIDVF